MESITYGLAGFSVGLTIFCAYFVIQRKSSREEYDRLEAELHKTSKDAHSSAKEVEILKQASLQTEKLENELREKLLKSETAGARQLAQMQELERRLKEQTGEQAEVARQMQEKFENLANRIFEQKSTKFSELNQEKLKTVLQPLDKDIREFRKKVEELHEKDSHQHVALREFVSGLQKAQSQLSEEARNLTRALKGDSKKQGDWGEFILERALEASGLTKGQEFSMQSSYDGKRPDAIIHLPGKRQLIIDAKVSLTAYERSISPESEADRKKALKDHLPSVRKHIDELSNKDYSSIEELTCPDFTLLFIPIEPAFAIALNADNQLYNKAFEKNIVIVTPTTLLATLRTIDSMWNNEKQQKNAIEIAIQAGRLYDQFVNLTEDLIKVGNQLKTVQGSYDVSMKKLTGTGNLIKKVEAIRKLGAKGTKNFNDKLLERATEDD